MLQAAITRFSLIGSDCVSDLSDDAAIVDADSVDDSVVVVSDGQPLEGSMSMSPIDSALFPQLSQLHESDVIVNWLFQSAHMRVESLSASAARLGYSDNHFKRKLLA